MDKTDNGRKREEHRALSREVRRMIRMNAEVESRRIAPLLAEVRSLYDAFRRKVADITRSESPAFRNKQIVGNTIELMGIVNADKCAATGSSCPHSRTGRVV